MQGGRVDSCFALVSLWFCWKLQMMSDEKKQLLCGFCPVLGFKAYSNKPPKGTINQSV